MKSIFKKILVTKRKNDAIVIASGLPRCGTSMMMQMLEAGGLPVVTDHSRKADEDNPRGYYELEKVKKIKEDQSWLEDCHGKAIKMVSALLFYLPKDRKYKVIFMKRNIEEMLASQKLMLMRLGNEDSISDIEMGKKYTEHLKKVMGWLSRQSNMEVIYLSYNEVVQNPQKNAERVDRFLSRRLNVDKMAGVVKESLYRQRRKDG